MVKQVTEHQHCGDDDVSHQSEDAKCQVRRASKACSNHLQESLGQHQQLETVASHESLYNSRQESLGSRSVQFELHRHHGE